MVLARHPRLFFHRTLGLPVWLWLGAGVGVRVTIPKQGAASSRCSEVLVELSNEKGQWLSKPQNPPTLSVIPKK